MTRIPRWLFVVGALCIVVGLTACGSSSKSSSSSSPTTPTTATGSKASGSIVVSAAASLNQAFTKIGKDFEAANPGTSVKFNFDSSATLVTQITSGAPADVFASADTTNMDKLSSKNLLDGSPQVFAKNALEIATKPGNPKNVKTLSDLETVGVVALCAVSAPCGKYADQVLQQAHVTIPSGDITRGENATATVGMVSQGDANAGIVYVTDVKGAGTSVSGVTIPADQNAIATYPIATLKNASNAATAQAFVQYVLSPAGQQTLQSYGFIAP
jgi:molybdate transport system substrate-binding protein